VSRFADPQAREKVDLGPCECPGNPHESDWAMFRAELSPAEVRRAIALDGLDEAGIAEGLAAFIPEWNLLGPNGQPWPPSVESIQALKFATLKPLIDGLAKMVAESARLPNASGVPSRASRRGSASRTRTPSRTPGT